MSSYLDLGLIIIVLISALLSMLRGFTREVLAIASWAVAAFEAFQFHPMLLPTMKNYIGKEQLALAAAVAVLFFGTLIIVSIITVKLSDLILDSSIGALDRTLGFLFGAARGFLIAAVAFLFFDKLVGEKQYPDWVRDAKLRPLLKESGDQLIALLPTDAGFLEKLVLDPAEAKELLAVDLLAHAGRRLHVMRNPETAMVVLVRALEAFAQRRLLHAHKIKSWDVRIEQLPQALQETCRTCYLEDIDGKYKLPLQAQFRVLAGLGDQLGQSFLREWPMMKPLLDAASHAVLGHGFEPIKGERVQQFYDVVVKLTGVSDSALPIFPKIGRAHV